MPQKKNSINLIKLNIEYHARLGIENTTRWSSSYLMLMSFHKAKMKNTFSAENPSPIDLETLELFLQILQPAYQFSLIMQKNKSSIAIIV